MSDNIPLDNVDHIVITEAQIACRDEPDLEKRLRKAMRSIKNFWLRNYNTDTTVGLSLACAAVHVEASEEDRAVIVKSKKMIDVVEECMNSGYIKHMPIFEDLDGVLPLIKYWMEA